MLNGRIQDHMRVQFHVILRANLLNTPPANFLTSHHHQSSSVAPDDIVVSLLCLGKWTAQEFLVRIRMQVTIRYYVTCNQQIHQLYTLPACHLLIRTIYYKIPVVSHFYPLWTRLITLICRLHLEVFPSSINLRGLALASWAFFMTLNLI